MAIKGITFDEQLVAAKNDGGLYGAILTDGVLWGCSASVSDGNLNISPGEFIAGGRVVEVSGVEHVALSPTETTGYCRIVVEIDLYATATATDFQQVTIKQEYSSTNSFPDLTQENINGAGRIYQMDFAKLKVESGAVTAVLRAPAKVRCKPVAENADLLDGKDSSYFGTAASVAALVSKFEKTYMGHIVDCNDIINGSGMITPHTLHRPPGNGYGPFHSANGSQYSIGYYRNRTSSSGSGTWSEWQPTPHNVFLPLTGGKMTGALNMDGHTLAGLPTPTGTSWAVPKSYMDATINQAIAVQSAAMSPKNGFSVSTDGNDSTPTAEKFNGYVDLSGQIKATAASSYACASIPPFARPTKRKRVLGTINVGTEQHVVPIFITAQGDAIVQWPRAASTINAVSFDGIRYKI